jgi:hypothetical protein
MIIRKCLRMKLKKKTDEIKKKRREKLKKKLN